MALTEKRIVSDGPGLETTGAPRSSEGGQSVVVLALFLVSILGMISLAVDLGYTYLQQRHAQTIADSSASAATIALTRGSTDSQVATAIANDVTANGIAANTWHLDTASGAATPVAGQYGVLAQYVYVPSGSQVYTSTGHYVGGGSIPTVLVGGVQTSANAIHIDYVKTTAAAFFARALGRKSFPITTVGFKAPNAVPTVPNVTPVPQDTSAILPFIGGTPTNTPTSTPSRTTTSTATTQPTNTSVPHATFCTISLTALNSTLLASNHGYYYSFTPDTAGNITVAWTVTPHSASGSVSIKLYAGSPSSLGLGAGASGASVVSPPTGSLATAQNTGHGSAENLTLAITTGQANQTYTAYFYNSQGQAVDSSSGASVSYETTLCPGVPTYTPVPLAPSFTPVPTGTATATSLPTQTPTQTQVPTVTPTMAPPSFPAGNSTNFVLWGGNAATPGCPYIGVCTNQTINFWGHSWASQVSAGNYLDNPRFKGFDGALGNTNGITITQSGVVADTSVLTACNPSNPPAAPPCWSVKSGNSFPPSTLPCTYSSCYLDMLVSNYIDASGPTNYGNVIAVVKVFVADPSSYGSNPGHAAYATIVGDVWELYPANPIVHCPNQGYANDICPMVAP